MYSATVRFVMAFISASSAPIGTGFLEASVLQRSIRCLAT
jgi:hypothetical protein